MCCQVDKAHSWTCMDLYVFATPYRVSWDYYFLSREHTFEFKEWEGKAEFEYVKNKGVSIFLMQAGMVGTLQALWDVFPLFTNTGWGENSNLGFLENVDDIHSGDFLAISKIRGRWGGFETLEKWVSGSYAGHTAVCLKDSEEKLWVGESGHENEKGEDIIVVLPWEEWWDFELNKDDSNPHIALLPLHPDTRAKFNETAAWEYARNMDGKPYGYHNMIFSWIDTIDQNYPPPLDSHLNDSTLLIWNKFIVPPNLNSWIHPWRKNATVHLSILRTVQSCHVSNFALQLLVELLKLVTLNKTVGVAVVRNFGQYNKPENVIRKYLASVNDG
ncbi:hypothetical protein FCV25MIE_09000 [Fagus crenata]